MRYRNDTYAKDVWDTYWYEKNLQGDILAIYDDTGAEVISYTYDAWGDFSIEYSGGGTSTANNGHLRYRGYFYDPDIKLYYLQTRYYDCKLHRFISPDNVAYLGANGGADRLNLYSYCNSTPVSYAQSSLSSKIAKTNIPASQGEATNYSLFGYKIEYSAGWEEDNLITIGNKFRIGVSTYETFSEEKKGIFYVSIGAMVNSMEEDGLSFSAGAGIDLWEIFGYKIQIEEAGWGSQFTIFGVDISGGSNIEGITYFTIVWGTEISDNNTIHTGFTAEVNTKWLIEMIVKAYVAYQYGVSGSPSYQPLPVY